MKSNAHHGMSLVEVLVAIALAGIMAMITIPQFLVSSPQASGNEISKIEQIMQQVAMAVQVYQGQTGEPLDFDATSLDSIIYTYGNYFARKTIASSPERMYYLLEDGTRITITPKVFNTGVLTEYPATTLPITQWADPDASSTEYYCGNYDSRECFYMDINGSRPPNTFGPSGDIVPFRVDPESGNIRTLYQWHAEDFPGLTNAQRCKFVSVYDMVTSAPGTDAAECQ